MLLDKLTKKEILILLMTLAVYRKLFFCSTMIAERIVDGKISLRGF